VLRPRMTRDCTRLHEIARDCPRLGGLVAPADDVVGEAEQRRRPLAVWLERRLGLVDELARDLARAVEAEQLRVCRLVGVKVLPVLSNHS